MEPRMTLDPIHQFNIDNLFKIGQIGNQAIYFTNSSVYMLVSVAAICLLMVGGAAGRQLVPGRFQSMAEVSYEFVASMIRSTAGPDGMKFFPLVFSLFMFILVSNVIGIIPYTFTVAGHITLKVFAGFVALLGASLGAIGWVGGVLPLALTVAMTALELLVAFLQAYVFAILTCIYLNDAIHP